MQACVTSEHGPDVAAPGSALEPGAAVGPPWVFADDADTVALEAIAAEVGAVVEELGLHAAASGAMRATTTGDACRVTAGVRDCPSPVPPSPRPT